MTDAGWVEGLREDLARLDRHGASRLRTADTATLPDLMETYRIPGISIAVASLDGGLWCSGYGTTGGSGPAPVGPRTVFQACSISKHVTAFGALRLVADGVLDLDANADDYLAEWHLPDAGGWRPRVTPRMLLAHTAGLSYNWFRGYDGDEEVPSPLQTLSGSGPANTPPVRPSLLPGSRFRYSGSHYMVLQQLMADVTATPFDELMSELVLGPAGMSDSSFSQRFPRQRPGLVALGHHVTGTPVPGGWRVMPEMAGAGLWTTPADLTRLELEIARAAAGESRLLGRELAGQMLTPAVPGGMGLGTEIEGSAGCLRFGHTGGNVGYGCFSFAWPGAGAAVAVMANSEGATEVLGSVLAAAERRYAPPPGAAVPPRSELPGRYQLREDYPVDIQADGARLVLGAEGQPPAELVPLAGGGYQVPGLDCEITFGYDGDVPVMRIWQEGAARTARRSPAPVP